MIPQVRDLVIGMIETKSIPCECAFCENLLTTENVYSPFATVCRECADVIEDGEKSWDKPSRPQTW